MRAPKGKFPGKLNPIRGVHGSHYSNVNFVYAINRVPKYRDTLQVEVRGGDLSVHDKRGNVQAFPERLRGKSLVPAFFLIFRSGRRDERSGQTLPRGAEHTARFFHASGKLASFIKSFGKFVAASLALVIVSVVLFLIVHRLILIGI